MLKLFDEGFNCLLIEHLLFLS